VRLYVTVLQVPSERVGLILGKGGLTVKDMQVRTGASIRIDIPQAGEPGYANPTRAVTIWGPGAETARAEIEMMVQTGYEQGPGGYYPSEDGNAGGLTDPYRQPAAMQPHHVAAAAAAAAQQQQQAAALAAQQYSYSGGQDAYSYAQQQQQQGQQQGSGDLTQYYAQFWQYAAYYGEKVAREQYGVWSPPVGTQPPPGVTLPPPGQEAPLQQL
jgi:far upstream element-binding protein